MPMIVPDEPSPYALPLSVIQEDLASLKHAYFTDPKDQSPWNYHAWLMSLLSPIQVVALRYLPDVDGKAALAIGLSHMVKSFSQLNISLVDSEGNPVEFSTSSGVATRRTLSSTWLICID